jgi:hypothetical protein
MSANKPDIEIPSAPSPARQAATGSPIGVGPAAVQAWADIGAETVRFVWERLQHDIKTQQAMLACTSLEEMRKIQTEFFTAAREQYAVEAIKLLYLIGTAAASGLTAAPKARRHDDVPL